MKAEILDWVEQNKVIRPTPKKSSRTQLQIVMLAEDTWLAQHLIPVDSYICPSEAIVKMRTRGSK